MHTGDRVTVTVFDERVPATVEEPYTSLGNVRVRLDNPIDDSELSAIPIYQLWRARADVEPLVVDEAAARPGADDAHAPEWAVGWHHQFDLKRKESGEIYLTRWWLVKTPYGGIAVHRMTAPDARSTLHDHPFSFVSIPIWGGYLEQRMDPRDPEKIYTRAITLRPLRGWRAFRQRRVNVMRRGGDAHVITELLGNPTWTLLFIGAHRRTWGFWEPPRYRDGDRHWRWTKHDAFDSGHYA